MLFETTNYTSFIHFRPLGDKIIAKKTPYMTVNVNKKANALFIIYALRLLLRLLFLLYLWRFCFSLYQQFFLDTSQQKRVHFPKHHKEYKEYKVSNAYLPSPPTMPQQIRPSRNIWRCPSNNYLFFPHSLRLLVFFIRQSYRCLGGCDLPGRNQGRSPR